MITNYCPVSPPGEPAYYTGSTNQTIYTYSTMGCALGYQAVSTGYPVYYCGPYNASNGIYTQVSGDCTSTRIIFVYIKRSCFLNVNCVT